MPPKPAAKPAAAASKAPAAKSAAAAPAKAAAKPAAAAPAKSEADAASNGPADGSHFQYTIECSNLPKTGASIDALVVLSMKDPTTGKLAEAGRTEVLRSENASFKTQFVSRFFTDKKMQGMVFEVFDVSVGTEDRFKNHEYIALGQTTAGDLMTQQKLSLPLKNKKLAVLPGAAMTLQIVPTTMTPAQFEAAQAKAKSDIAAAEAKAAADKKAAEAAAAAAKAAAAKPAAPAATAAAPAASAGGKGAVLSKSQVASRIAGGAEEIEDDEYAEEGFDDYGEDDFDADDSAKPPSELQQSISRENAAASTPAGGFVQQAMNNITQTNQGGFVAPAGQRQFAPIVVRRETDEADKRARAHRIKAVLKQVKLNVEHFDVFNLPVVPRYDVYLREISTNKKREVASQHNDDSASVEVQTEVPDSFDGGCQFPEDVQQGGKGEINESTGAFARFVQAASQVIRNLLLENLTSAAFVASSPGAASSAVGIQTPSAPQFEAFSSHSCEISAPLQLGERPVRDMHFSTGRTQLLLVAYGPVLDNENNKRLAAQQIASASAAPGDGAAAADDSASKSAVLGRKAVGSSGLAFEGLKNRGLLCLFDVLQPETPSHVLFVDGDPLTCCLSPNHAHIAFAGLAEGSVAVWDLREATTMHRAVQVSDAAGNKSRLVLRAPTFTTEASTLIPEHGQPASALLSIGPNVVSGHRGRVVKVTPVWEQAKKSAATASSEGKTDDAEGLEQKEDSPSEVLDLVARSIGGSEKRAFQLASLDDTGVAIVWSVVELKAGDMAGSDVDLGLGIGARIKLVKQNLLTSPSPSWLGKSDAASPRAAAAAASAASPRANIGVSSAFSFTAAPPIAATDLVSSPLDSNEFLVAREAADGGPCVLRASRFGKTNGPFDFSHTLFYEEGLRDARRDVCTTLSFHPLFPEYFLAGFKSGTLCLFSIKTAAPLQVWPSLCEGGVVKVNWSSFRPGVFFVLDNKNMLHTWDLLQSDQQPASRASLADASGSGAALFAVSNRTDEFEATVAPAAARKDHGSALLAFPVGANGRATLHVLKPFLSDMIKPNEAQLFIDYVTHLH